MAGLFDKNPTQNATMHCVHCGDTQAIRKAVDDLAVATPCPYCTSNCPKCGGRGWLIRPGVQAAAVATKCECRSLHDRIARFNAAEIPAHYANVSIEHLDDRANDTLRTAKQRALRAALRDGAGDRGLGLVGPVGCGKTHLLAGIVSTLTLDRGIDARFVEFTHLLSRIRAGYDANRSENEIIAPLVNAPILVIDELGKGVANEWQLSVLDELVSKRYNRGRTIHFSSNFQLTPIDRGGSKRSREQFETTTLEDRIGSRIYSRICEMCDIVTIDAPDFRRRSVG
jgi:DNA replication protein DnaC